MNVAGVFGGGAAEVEETEVEEEQAEEATHLDSALETPERSSSRGRGGGPSEDRGLRRAA